MPQGPPRLEERRSCAARVKTIPGIVDPECGAQVWGMNLTRNRMKHRDGSTVYILIDIL